MDFKALFYESALQSNYGILLYGIYFMCIEEI